MTHDELNDFIYNYLVEDKTKSAIMLTAPWGVGKSYYIKEILKPFIENKEEGKHKCIIVSLYDIASTSDLSRALFLEKKFSISKKNRSKKLGIGKAIVTGITGIGKTVLKAFTSIDLDIGNPNLQHIYDAVDYSNDLIVLEDLERSRLSVCDVLGYVNNLVEQDGVKVLLVANEEEIIKGTQEAVKDKYGKEEVKTNYTAQETIYLETKEKTIRDTIHYSGSTAEAIENILKSFNNDCFNGFLSQKDEFQNSKVVSDILGIMKTLACYNLRSFIFGCQKTIDLYKFADPSFNKEFLQFLLYADIAFSLRLKQNEAIEWDTEDAFSYDLGTYTFPLPKACFKYIKKQQRDILSLKKAEAVYTKQKAEEHAQNEIKPYLDAIYEFPVRTEDEVRTAILFMLNKLETTQKVKCSIYKKLANRLILIRDIIGCENEIQRCLDAMIKNVSESTDSELEEELFFIGGTDLITQEERTEFSNWEHRLIDSIKQRKRPQLFFSYQSSDFEDYYKTALSRRDEYYNKKRFATLFDEERLTNLLEEASSLQIRQLRNIFDYVYSPANIDEFLHDDKSALVTLKKEVDRLIGEKKAVDKIALYQLKGFSSDLQCYIDKLK